MGTVNEEILTLQAAMLPAETAFSENELRHLACVIRLTVEFRRFLRGEASDAVHGDSRYVAESVFSGVDSFCALSSACRSIGIALPGRARFGDASVRALSDEFSALYEELFLATDFALRCRLLLDLFRLQIVAAGILYE